MTKENSIGLPKGFYELNSENTPCKYYLDRSDNIFRQDLFVPSVFYLCEFVKVSEEDGYYYLATDATGNKAVKLWI
jgi:hypothetical protein